MRSANTLVSTIPFIIINDNAPKLFHIELPLLALSGPHYADISALCLMRHLKRAV